MIATPARIVNAREVARLQAEVDRLSQFSQTLAHENIDLQRRCEGLERLAGALARAVNIFRGEL